MAGIPAVRSNAERRIAAAVLAVVLAACGGSGGATPSTTSKPSPVPSTETPAAPGPGGSSRPTVVDPVEPAEPVASTVPEPPEPGLPSSLGGVPPADVITLTGSSTLTTSMSITGVALDEVVFWLAAELGSLGWAVGDPVAGDGGARIVPFVGPGAAGEAQAAPVPDGIDVVVVVHARS